MTDKVKDDEVEEEVSLRDEIAAAFKDTEEGTVIDKQNDLKRDESGKFAKKEATDEPDKVEKEPAEIKEEAKSKDEPGDEKVEQGKDEKANWTQDKAPQSWAPKARERWTEIPEDLRREIVRREEAAVAGVRQLHDSFAPVRQFAQDLSPFINEAIQAQVNPSEYIGRVLTAERSLRAGSPEQKFEALVGIAESYGIPLRKIINDAVGQEIVKAPAPQVQLPPEIMRELQEARQFRAQMQQQQQQQVQEDPPELVEFAKKNEFFEDVREEMANLLESGVVKTIDDAYTEACWRNPGVRELMMERKEKGNEQQDRQKAAAKVGKTKTSNSATVTQDESEDDDDIHATVRKAAAALANNRV